jgi:hypothetical protein
VGKKRQWRPNSGESVILYSLISTSNAFFILAVIDPDQGIEKQVFHLGGAAAVKFVFHGDPQVVGIGKQMPVQPEPFFHFSLDKIALDRIAYLAVNGNGEPACQTAVFQKVQKKNHFLLFWHFLTNGRIHLPS